MTKTKQIKLLVECAYLLAKHKVCNEPSFKEWWNIVKFCHKKGYLYVGFKGASVALVAIGFRIPKPPKGRVDLPEIESGKILYISAVASESESPWQLYWLYKWYLRNNTDITKVIFNKRNTDNLRIHKVRRPSHGRRRKTKLPKSA